MPSAIAPRAHSKVTACILAVVLSVLFTAIPASSPLRVPTAVAQPAIAFDIILHSGYLGVRTASLERPTVRVYSPSGGLKIARAAEGTRPEDGRWIIQFTLDAGGPPVLVEPGDRVEATVGEAVTSIEVPQLTATADVNADTISGQALRAGLVYAVLHRDAALFDGELNPPAIVGTAGDDGRFTIDVGESFDLRPGTWGEILVFEETGNVFVVPFAPPFARVYAGQYIAVVRADGPSRPTIAVLDEAGAELSRGAVPIAYGNGTFLVVLVRGGDFEGAFLPEPGEQVGIVIDDEIVAAESITWLSTSIDPAVSEVRGHGPPGARLGVAVYPEGDDDGAATAAESRISRVGEDGRWREAFPTLDLGATSEASTEVWSGGAFVHALTGRVPFVELELYGNSFTGVLEGRGEIEVVHTPAGGGDDTRGYAYAPATGEFEVALFDRGDEQAIGSGDRIEILSESGESRTLVVPDVAVEAIEARRGLRGTVPSGAGVTAGLYPSELNLFGIYQFDLDNTLLETIADNTGAFEMRCPADDVECGARYGYVAVRDGADGYTLRWIDGPAFGVAVTRSNALGYASAGARVSVEGDGLDEARTAVSRPQPLGRLPGWELPLNDVHPGGLPLGSRYRITTDGELREIVVPRFEWSADTRLNTVIGSTDLAFRAVFVVAYSNGDESRPPVGIGSAVIGADGRWSVALTDFNLLPGDDIEMYVFEADHFLQWHETGVEGPDEPTPTPVPPSPMPTAVPPVEPTPERARDVFLPIVRSSG